MTILANREERRAGLLIQGFTVPTAPEIREEISKCDLKDLGYIPKIIKLSLSEHAITPATADKLFGAVHSRRRYLTDNFGGKLFNPVLTSRV